MRPFTKNGNCPRCDTGVGWVRRFIKSAVWVRWNCDECGARLKFDLGRRLVVGGTTGLVTGAFVVLIDDLRWWVIPLAIVLYTVIWSFDSVSLADQESSDSEAPAEAGA